MEEETLIFIPIFIPLALSLGYDTVVGMSIPFIGAFTGFSSAFVNPFTVGIAQTIAQLPMYSGWQYRLVVWFVFTSVVAGFFTWYGEKVRKHPSKSLTAKKDIVRRAELNIVNDVVVDETFRLTRAHKLVFLSFLAGMGILFYGIIKYQWYMTEIAAVFLGVTLAAAYFGKLQLNEATDAMIAGAQSMVGVCILMALARSIVIVATDGHILDGDAFVLSFVSLGVMRCGGSAGWLVRWLLVFSASLASPLMYLYWLRHLTGRRRFDGLEAACVLCLCALIGSVDFRLVSPLLARLIHG